jgi:CheY-like chemotaxis protein
VVFIAGLPAAGEDARDRVGGVAPGRGDNRFKEVPVLMLTTEGSQHSIVTAIKAGATSYMTKPFFEKDLQTRMLDCLGLGFE